MRAWGFSIASLLLACSESSAPPNAGRDTGPSGSPADAAVDAVAPAVDARAAAPDAAAADPCSAAALRQPTADTTYYVAVAEPGADNNACDGLAPSDEGAGHCPFKDLSAPRVAGLLDQTSRTRVELRSGTYVVSGWEGLRISGMGASEAERVVLSAYPGEHPVLDVGAPDGAGCTAATAMENPQCVRQVLRISGSYTVVQGLTIQNGLGYHVEFNGGDHHLFRCNTVHETVAFAMRSDLVKLDGGAREIQLLHNDFSRFRSQAIDMTQVSDVLIEDNEFHDPIDADAGATGAKFGARRVTIRGNRVHDLGADPQAHAFSLGGTGSEHPDDQTAYEIHVERNRVWNVAGKLAQLVSCRDCALTDNDVWDLGAGVLLSAAATGTPECSAGGATGCRPTTNARITGNRMRAFDGNGDRAQSNIFLAVEAGEQQGLVSNDNLYCTIGDAPARFVWLGDLLELEAFRSAAGSDAGSRALPATDPACTAF